MSTLPPLYAVSLFCSSRRLHVWHTSGTILGRTSLFAIARVTVLTPASRSPWMEACAARGASLALGACAARADLDTMSSTRERKQQMVLNGACHKVGPVLVPLSTISIMSTISLPIKIRCHREERSRELTAQAACLIRRGRDTRCNATR